VIKVSWSCKKRKWKLQFDDGFVDLTASFKLSRVETISIYIAWFSCTIFPKDFFGKRKGLQCSTSCSYSRGGDLVYDDPEVKFFPFIAALSSLFYRPGYATCPLSNPSVRSYWSAVSSN
jgi:hypothetical protein